MNVTLIIPTYRNPLYLDMCLKSAIENRIDENNHILVVVDGFIEESQSILDKYTNIRYIDLGTNKGMQHALNIGVMHAETELIFIINDDNVMPRRWDVKTINAYHDAHMSDANYVLTVNQIEPTGPGMFDHAVCDMGRVIDTFRYEEFLNYEEEISSPVSRLDGEIFPFVLLKKHYMAVGGFDVFYDSPNICDWDFFLKLELMDFRFPRTRRLHLYHFGSVVTRKNSESALFANRQNQAFEFYQFKWGITPYNKPGSNNKIPPDGKFRGFHV